MHAQFRLLLAPAAALLILYRLRRGDRWPLQAPALVALGAAVIAYLPLRSARAPAAHWAQLGSSSALLDYLQAGRIRRAFADQILVPNLTLLGERLRALALLVERQLALPALLLALVGLVWLLRRRRPLGVILLLM